MPARVVLKLQCNASHFSGLWKIGGEILMRPYGKWAVKSTRHQYPHQGSEKKAWLLRLQSQLKIATCASGSISSQASIRIPRSPVAGTSFSPNFSSVEFPPHKQPHSQTSVESDKTCQLSCTSSMSPMLMAEPRTHDWTLQPKLHLVEIVDTFLLRTSAPCAVRAFHAHSRFQAWEVR
jgi:hypothetical protein